MNLYIVILCYHQYTRTPPRQKVSEQKENLDGICRGGGQEMVLQAKYITDPNKLVTISPKVECTLIQDPILRANH